MNAPSAAMNAPSADQIHHLNRLNARNVSFKKITQVEKCQ